MEGALILANQKAAFAQPLFWRVSFALPEVLSDRRPDRTLNIMLV